MNTLMYDAPQSLTSETLDRLALGQLVQPARTWRSSLQIAIDVAAARRRAWATRLR